MKQRIVNFLLLLTLGVQLNAFAALDENIKLLIEEPATAGVYSGVSNIRGWAVAPTAIERVDLFIDENFKGTIPSGGTRKDVGNAFPSLPNSSESGYSMAFNFSRLGVGSHSIRVIAYDVKGNHNQADAIFSVVSLASSFVADPEAVSLGGASTSLAGESLHLNNFTAEGAQYDAELVWNSARQAFVFQALHPSGNPQLSTLNTAILHTNMGDIAILLDPLNSPTTVSNFKSYANRGFYSDTLFHSVVDGFVIQGGGFDGNGELKPAGSPIQNESDNGLSNLRGTISMARVANPHSATSQFFINLKDNTHLDYTEPTASGWGYAVFGHVIAGMDVVDAIAKVQVDDANMPLSKVLVESVTLQP